MQLVILTAIGVGGATVIGALTGFAFKHISHKFSDIVLAFAAGVMLSASILGLILPSLDFGGRYGLPITVVGIFCGAICLNLLDKVVPHLHRLAGVDSSSPASQKDKLGKVMLFVAAIAIHNLPEGIAAGVGFGSENVAEALTIAGAIALQNIPEGMVIISPMLSAGVGKGRAFLLALITGLIEVAGTFIGYFAVTAASAILPLALAFAGGAMLYVISDEMIPETHAHGSERGATYALIIGFCVMLAADFYIGGPSQRKMSLFFRNTVQTASHIGIKA